MRSAGRRRFVFFDAGLGLAARLRVSGRAELFGPNRPGDGFSMATGGLAGAGPRRSISNNYPTIPNQLFAYNALEFKIHS
jgi:hypothetical protein